MKPCDIHSTLTEGDFLETGKVKFSEVRRESFWSIFFLVIKDFVYVKFDSEAHSLSNICM